VTGIASQLVNKSIIWLIDFLSRTEIALIKINVQAMGYPIVWHVLRSVNSAPLMVQSGHSYQGLNGFGR